MSKHRRVYVTLTPDLDRAATRLARALGRPVSTVLREFLVEAVPAMDDLAEVFEGGDSTEVLRRFDLFSYRVRKEAEQLALEARVSNSNPGTSQICDSRHD